MTYNISGPQNWHFLKGTWICLGIERMLKMLPQQKVKEWKCILLDLRQVYTMIKVLFDFSIDPSVMEKDIISI